MSDLQSFHEVLFPLAVSFGATGGPERRNEIVTLTSGREHRNARFAHSRRRYDAGTGLRSLDDLYEVIAFFEARRGSLHGFRFRDPFDMKSCARRRHRVAARPGDRQRRRHDGDLPARQDLWRRRRRLSAADRQAGRRQRAGRRGRGREGGGRRLRRRCDDRPGDLRAGAVPAAGAAVTAGFEFDVPVRFDLEHLSVSLTAFKAGQIPAFR